MNLHIKLLLQTTVVLAITYLSSNALGESVIKVNNVPFCTGGVSTLRMDYGRPAVGSNLPAMILVHSGGFMAGERGEFSSFIDEAAKQGFFAATIDYRLTAPWTSAGSSETQAAAPFPAQIEDVNCAIRHVRANAAKYGINPGKIGIMGASAGAELSILAAYAPTKFAGRGGYGGVSQAVSLVVDWFGGTDNKVLYNTNEIPLVSKLVLQLNLQMLLLGTPMTQPAKYRDSSPIIYVGNSSPITFIAHGDADTLIPISQSYTLRNKLQSYGVKTEMLVVPGGDHGFTNADLRNYAADKTFSFLNAYLK